MKPLFLDIDTQNDFLLPAGALYVPGAELLIPVIGTLNEFAVAHGFPVISTACLHAEDDQEFRDWPPHCIAGTVGQWKPQATLRGQTIFSKQTTDVFRHPGWLPLLAETGATEYIVYGVATEVCVRSAAEGLLALGAPVTIATDAVKALDETASEAFLEAFCRKGGRVLTSHQVLSRF